MCERCTAEVEVTGKSRLSVYQKNHKDVIRQNRKKLCDELSEWFYDYKKNFHCMLCGEDHPAALTFHHRDPSQKKDDIAHMVTGAYTKKKILAEIAKCDVLCMNCHVKIHDVDRRSLTDNDLIVKPTDTSEVVRKKKKRITERKKQQEYFEIKSKLKCQFCGETHPSCLEFHHRNPSEKTKAVGLLSTHSKNILLAEIAKCDVLCSNCHRKFHHTTSSM